MAITHAVAAAIRITRVVAQTEWPESLGVPVIRILSMSKRAKLMAW